MAVDATLLRVPDYAPATQVSGQDTTTFFSPTDPWSGAAVSAALSIFANKHIAADPEVPSRTGTIRRRS